MPIHPDIHVRGGTSEFLLVGDMGRKKEGHRAIRDVLYSCQIRLWGIVMSYLGSKENLQKFHWILRRIAGL